jgi:TonB-linked SusC/RagA family outer membrane protein
MDSSSASAARRFLGAASFVVLSASVAAGQTTGTVRGHITDATSGGPLGNAQITVTGTNAGAVTNAAGDYIANNVPAGAREVVARRVGYARGVQQVTVTAGSESRADFTLTPSASQLDAIVVTALGQSQSERAVGFAQQTVDGSEVSQTLRPNFINSLQGRVAGVDVTPTSGAPGASSLITIRGVSSISSTNQPLIIVDGLPIDNKTTSTATLASDAPTSALAFNNRGVDFTNRAADLNPDDVASLTVLKGPAAAALYGIGAANGAIVITTKRGQSGGGFEYSGTYRVESVRAKPVVQDVYGPSGAGVPGVFESTTGGSFLYFGSPYPTGTKFYDNVSNFFQTGASSTQRLAFSGASPSNNVSYRVSSALEHDQGVIPNSDLQKVNITGATQGTVNSWLGADLSMMYTNANNDMPFKGDNGPMIGLLLWPDTNNAANYLTPAGTRARLTSLSAGSEVDNPYFNVFKNKQNAKTNHLISNLGATITPMSWGSLHSMVGVDAYTDQLQQVRNPESAMANAQSGILDINDDVQRNVNSQTVLTINPIALGNSFSLNGLVGNAITDEKDVNDGSEGTNFLDPNFISINNTLTKYARTIISRRRLVGAFGSATLSFRDLLYVTATGRNDWTSTIPTGRNSFFYPSLSASYILSDAFPGMRHMMTAKLRAAYAEVGRDAAPYSYATTLESKTTSGGGYGYGFTGPNPLLEPEFAKSYEGGVELGFLDNRVGLDLTGYNKRTENQIVQNVRESYGTGFILFNLNGATTENKGIEAMLRASPIQQRNSAWDISANFTLARGKTLSLPNALPESYNSDTWLYGNVRNGTEPGLSTMSLTGLFYQRNKNGQLEIDPTTGLPVRSTTFIDGGYDRQPKFTIGLENSLRRGPASLSFLFDIRKGGDVFDATDHFLTTRGLSTSTLDRWTPRVIPGVLRDGKENSDNPTPNNVVVTPALNTNYYTNMSEELFIQKDINWLRLRDVTLAYELPQRLIGRYANHASVFITGTDLFLWTNYTGLDPLANGTDAASGGSSGVGIDFANYPIGRAFNFGLKIGY